MAYYNDRCAKTFNMLMNPVEVLILDLPEWIGPQLRPYSEVIDAWRTSCPRLPVWEEASARRFIERQHTASSEAMIAVTASGIEFLCEQRAAQRERWPSRSLTRNYASQGR